MLIQAIDYMGNKILKAYKNGVIVWHPFITKYYDFGPTNILLIDKSILGTALGKPWPAINIGIELVENYPFYSEKAGIGNITSAVEAINFNDFSSSIIKERKISQSILASSIQPLCHVDAAQSITNWGISFNIKTSINASQKKKLDINNKIIMAAPNDFIQASTAQNCINTTLLGNIKTSLFESSAIASKLFSEVQQLIQSQLYDSLSAQSTAFVWVAEILREQLRLQSSQNMRFNQAVNNKTISIYRDRPSAKGKIENIIQEIFRTKLNQSLGVYSATTTAIRLIEWNRFRDRKSAAFAINQTIFDKALGQIKISESMQLSAKQPIKVHNNSNIIYSKAKNPIILDGILEFIETSIYFSLVRKIDVTQAILNPQWMQLRIGKTSEITSIEDINIYGDYSLDNSISIRQKLWNKIELNYSYVTLNRSPIVEKIVNELVLITGNYQLYKDEVAEAKIFENIFVNSNHIVFVEPPSFDFNVNHQMLVNEGAIFRDRIAKEINIKNISNIFNYIVFVNGIVTSFYSKAGVFVKSIIPLIKGEVRKMLPFSDLQLRYRTGFFNGEIVVGLPSGVINPLTNIIFVNAKERKWKIDFSILSEGYGILSMSTSLVSFYASQQIKEIIKNTLILQKLYEQNFSVRLNSVGIGSLDFFVSYNGFINNTIGATRNLLEFTKYNQIEKSLGSFSLSLSSVFSFSLLYQINKASTKINLLENITLGMSNYNIITQDFYYNINYYLSALFDLSQYHWNGAGAHTGFHNLAILGFANDDERWRYPIWNSEVEEERNNIFITQVFSFSYNSGEIR